MVFEQVVYNLLGHWALVLSISASLRDATRTLDGAEAVGAAPRREVLGIRH
ncbi:MAG: hypothetical protein V7K21_22605 [Nostoc sp.]|uniref:hypothetical protein n=1 Tax=Nostoc sp. TaxID=1180 RepID=UPI002FF6FD47